MMRFVWFAALLGVFLAASSTHALEYSSPIKLRVGASVGLLGSLPVGDDVGQAGAPDEFRKGLWVHAEPVSFDLGAYVQLSGFFRLAVAGTYDTDALGDSLDLGRLVSGPERKAANIGALARVFPFGDGLVRPFLSLGLGYITAGASFSTCPVSASDLGGLGSTRVAGATRKQADGGSTCPITASQQGSYRHRGVGIGLGLGVRIDPQLKAFGEPWRLPILLEVAYQKNFWTGLDRSPEGIFDDDSDGLSGIHPNVDFLGLLVTFGFLR